MTIALIALQIFTLVVVLVLIFRKSGATQPDPRLDQLLAADLAGQLTRLDADFRTLENHLRGELGQLRTDNATASATLRGEVLGNINTLGETLRTTLGNFRTDNTASSETLRTAVDAQLKTLSERFSNFTTEVNRTQADSRETLHTNLKQLGKEQTEQQEKLRGAVEQRLDSLNTTNAAKLEEMRQTVDEKLHATLQTRLTESFGTVTDQLAKVYTGLGEMTKLSAGVDDLSRIFTNVKSRGTIGEVLLENLLKQMLASNQYEKNVKPKAGSNDIVEFCVKLPTGHGEMLLPIDSKFPRESGERLETAYTNGTPEEIAAAGRAFEGDIRKEAKKICEKYVSPPNTTSFAILFLPTESLYAEVMRRDGLQSDIQQNCHVTIAGPSTLSAILTSFQMGFHMLQLQEKGDDVWKVLASARKEFGTFETLMSKMTDDIGRVQGTIDKLGVRTRAINRTLRDVSLETLETGLPAGSPGAFDGMLPMLAASDDEA
ncbi:MAG: DNA recombination protein RmuC [Bryocella sp.]